MKILNYKRVFFTIIFSLLFSYNWAQSGGFILPPSADPKQTFDSLIKTTTSNFFSIARVVDSLLVLKPDTSQEEGGFKTQYDTWKEFMGKRCDANGKLIGMVKALPIFNQVGSCSNGNTWTGIGPDCLPWQATGVVWSVWAEPNPKKPGDVGYNPAFQPQFLLAGSDNGLWKTTDGGKNWKCITDKANGSFTFPYLNILSIVVNPIYPDSIYVSTFFFPSNGINDGAGVYYTANGGITWQRDDAINSILDVSPGFYGSSYPNILTKTSKVFISPNTNTMYCISGTKVYRRQKNHSWVKILETPKWYAVFDEINFVPDLGANESDVLFVSTAYQANCELWRIKENLNSTNPPVSQLIFDNTEFLAIKVSIPDKNNLYILAGVDPDIGKIYKDTQTNYLNLGDSIKFLNQADSYWLKERGRWRFGRSLVTHFAVSKNKASDGKAVMYFGIDQLLKSINNGVNAVAISDYSSPSSLTSHGDIRALKLYYSSTGNTSGSSDILIAGTDGGVCCKRPDSSNVTNLNGKGLTLGAYSGITSSENDASFIAGGMSHDGTWVRKYGTWKQFSEGDNAGSFCDDYIVAGDTNNSNNLLDQNDLLGGPLPLQYGSNYGRNAGVSIIPTGVVTAIGNKPFRLKTEQGDVYVGYNEIRRLQHNPTPPLFAANPNPVTTAGIVNSNNNARPIIAFDVNSNITDTLYMIYNNDGTRNILYRWIGTTATNVTPNISQLPDGLPITNVAINPANARELWITIGGYYISGGTTVANTYRVLYSNNGGANWYDRSYGLPDLPVDKIVYQKGTDDMLYIGTDAGVYVWKKSYTTHNTSTGSAAGYWDCFSKNLPVAYVIDLNINYCGQKLRASLLGHGIYEADLLKSNAPVVYGDGTTTGSFTLSSSQKFTTDVLVKKNATLTITGASTIINMARGMSIKVEAGGVLNVINGATIDNLCGEMWRGIEIWGNSNLPQTTTQQGSMTINGNSILRNMEFGVMLSKPYGNPLTDGFDPTGNGGILNALYARFENNRRSVGFGAYTAANSTSYLSLCTFVNTTRPVAQAVSLLNIHGVSFAGNTFTSNLALSDTNRGVAVFSIDADYTFSPFFNTRNTFSNYFRGIEIHNTVPFGAFTNKTLVNRSDFTNCNRAIYFAGIDYSKISECTFTLNPSFASTEGDYNPYCVYLDGCNYYWCQNNTFNSYIPLPASPLQAGTYYYPKALMVNNNSTVNTQIRKNTVSGFWTGFNPVGINGGINAQSQNAGLQFKCNTFNNRYDLYLSASPLTFGSLHPQQGYCQTNSSLPDYKYAPASNIFPAYTCAPFSFKSNIYKETNTLGINYTYPVLNGSSSGYYPGCIATGVTRNACNLNLPGAVFNDLCPDSISQGRSTAKIAGSNTPLAYAAYPVMEQDALISELENKLYEAGKASLLTKVQNAAATEVSEVFTELEQKEALSDEVLKAAIHHPAADRGLGHLKEVIIQNSGLKDEIVEELADRQLPYSGAEINEMVQAQTKRSPYDQLQDQLTGAKTKRDIALQEGILYLLDSNNTKDALLLLGNEKGSFALRKKAEIYLAQKDWAKAQEYIDSFESADKGYGVLLQLSLAQQQAAKSMSELSDAQLQAVRAIAQNGNDKSQMQAKSLLLLNKGETYEEYNPKVPEEERAGKKETTEKPNPWLKMKAFDKTQLEITPKPANERATIKIQLDDIKEGVQLKIIDARGVEQRSYAIQDRYTSIEVDTKAFTSGIYICIVMQDSKILLKSTLNITH